MIDKKEKNNDLTSLKSEVNLLRKSLLNFRFQKSSGQLEKTSEIKKTRKKIARLETSITKEKGNNNA